MIHGVDTGFLVAMAIAVHPDHTAANRTITQLSQASDTFAIAPQILAEFIHVVTDPRRFSQSLDMPAAQKFAESWWTAYEVVQVFPDDLATRQFLTWLRQHALGRKRILDTLLAATYERAGIRSLLTTNPADFAIFGVFNCITP